MWNLRDKYAIAGIGYTDFTKQSGRTTRSLASEACLKAINDAGIDADQVDGIVSYNMGDSAPGIAVATELGLPRAHYMNDMFAGGNVAVAFMLHATAVIEAGLASNVLCFRSMNGRSGVRLGGSRDQNAYGFSQYTAPFGWITYPQAMAMWCRRHMSKYGTTSAQLGAVAVNCRKNAALNERAMQRKPMTLDDYFASRPIVDPFRMYDICLESDGACAVLITSAERARDLKQKPVYINGGAYGGGPAQGFSFEDIMRWPDPAHNCFPYIADDLWKSAGVGPKDMDFAEIYDCFTYSTIMALEGMGFCKEGEGGPYVESGAIDLKGSLPVNTHGGLLSEAYIHGFNHTIEAVEQLRGVSGVRQVPGASIGLVTAGAMTCGGAMVLRN